MLIEVSLLGPVELRSNGQSAALGPAKRRALLAGLALEVNRPVPLPELTRMAWAGPPPRSVLANLRTHVAVLRRLLGGRITSRPGSYQLDLEPDELDVTVFRRLAADGRMALTGGDTGKALSLFAAALDCWHGPAGHGLPCGTALDVPLAGLEQERLHVFEDLVEARLAEGEHGQLLGDLRQHLDRNPLRERAWAQLMLACYRSGDTAAALDTYREARSVLTEQLGTEPGDELTTLHRAVLDGVPELKPPPITLAVRKPAPEPGDRPRELPADLVTLVGRTREVADVVAAVREATAPTPAAVVVCGAGGSGKSAVAVRAAHLLAAEFPDGQLYLDLGDRPAAGPADVLARVLRALGAPALGSARADERAGRYRSLVADRRILVVVDGVGTAAQVRPLVPAGPGPALIVTSRRQLGSLDGVRRVAVEPLPAADGYALLAALVGAHRLDTEPAATAELLRLCAGSPLALRIVGARLASRPEWSVGTLAEQFADRRHRLDVLAYGDLSMRACLAAGYELVRSDDEVAAQAFRLLGELPEQPAGAREAAVRLGVSTQRAWRALEELVDAHLAYTDRSGRYRLPVLVRQYADEIVRRVPVRLPRLAANRRPYPALR